MSDIANFIYELGSARRILRTHKQFIGTSDESVSDHIFRVAFISLLLAQDHNEINYERLILMALVHDVAEIRTGDMNPINSHYCAVNEREAFQDQIAHIGKVSQKLLSAFDEYHMRETVESKIVKDADVLEQIALQVEYKERGVSALSKWHDYQLPRLTFDGSKKVAESLMGTSSFDWLHKITLKDPHDSC